MLESSRSVEPRRTRRFIIALLAAAVLGGVILVWYAREGFVETRRREQIVATIQREARASFLVTGSLDITATITYENSRTLLPGLLNLGLGTSRATVQVPGRAYYGFDVRTLEPKHVEIRGDTVRLRVPEPRVLSVEPNLAQLRTWTSQGWLRTPTSVQEAQNAALRSVNAALFRQAQSHVANSAQPRVNTARALELMLRPVLAAMGIEKPHFRFELGQHVYAE